MNSHFYPRSLFACFLWGGVDRTLGRKSLRESVMVSAVIVNHVILLHPVESVFVQLFVRPRTWSRRWCIRIRFRMARRRAYWWKPNACPERSSAPVCLHATALRCPVIRVPQARVYSHCLVLWVWNSNTFWILELSNWCPIHRESEIELLLSVSFALGEYISVKCLRIPSDVTQEFEVLSHRGSVLVMITAHKTGNLIS